MARCAGPDQLGQYVSGLCDEAGGPDLELGADRPRALDLDVEGRRLLVRGKLFAAAQQAVDKRLGRTRPRPVATIQQMCAVYAALLLPGEKETQAARITTFLRVSDMVARQRCRLEPIDRTGHKLAVDQFEVARAPMLLLDEDYVPDYVIAMAGKLQPGTPDYNRRMRSIAANVSPIRGFFQHDILDAFEKNGLFVPLPVGFLNATVSCEFDTSPLVHDPALVRVAFQLLAKCADGRSERMFLIIALALHGLRATDIANLRRTGLQRTTGYSIGLRPGYESIRGGGEVLRHQKKHHERIVSIPEWLYRRLEAWFSEHPGEFFLEGDSESARLVACPLADQWLRSEGLDVERPLPQLRAFYAGYLCSTAKSVAEIILNMGHDNLVTTTTYYAKHPFKRDIVALWDMAFPLEQRRVAGIMAA